MTRRPRLTLQPLESRDVPAPIVTHFSGALSTDLQHIRFPPGLDQVPTGSTIKVTFGASPDPTGKYMAQVGLVNPKGKTLQSKTLRLSTERPIMSQKVTDSVRGPWEVTVLSVGKDPEGSYPYFGSTTITLPDVAVTGATYIGGQERTHRNPTGVRATYTITDGLKETFAVGLYRSADGTNPSGGALREQTVTADGKAGSKTVTLDTNQPLRGDPNLPFLVVVADRDKKVDEDNEGNNTRRLDLPAVRLTIPDPGSLTLMEDQSFTVDAGRAAAGGYRVEVRQTGEADTAYVQAAGGGSGTLTVTPRLARQVDYLASATVSGGRFYADRPTRATVQFPTRATVAGDGDVQAATLNLWTQTVAFAVGANGQDWHELGAVVLLDTSDGTYSLGPTVTGGGNHQTPQGPTHAAIDNIAIPASQIDHAHQTGIYAVAYFHTHPADMWRAVAGQGRIVGPSGGALASGRDVASLTQAGIPGLVYDYTGQTRPPAGQVTLLVGSWVLSGADPHAPAQLYDFGPERRRQ